MNVANDPVATEQAKVDDLYARAETLSRQLDGPVHAASSVAEKAAQAARNSRLEQLHGVIEDRSRLIAIGRVDFDGGSHAGRTVYIGRTLIGDPDEEFPPMSSWRAEVAGAFYNPLGFEDGDVVALKRAIVGSDRLVRDLIDERPREVRERLERDRSSVDEERETPSPTPTPTPTPRPRPVSPAPPRKSPRRPNPAPRSLPPPAARPTVRRQSEAQRPEVPVAPRAAARTTGTPQRARSVPEDPLVRQLLERQGTRLAPIIETIQARQYALMERPMDRTLVIQGGPGTGKTVIALHRVAVQLYRSRGELSHSDILFVGPSRTFIGYVDRVLPSLGEHDVVHRAVQDLATHGAVPRGHDAADAALVKGLPQMAEVIDRFLRGRARIDRRDIRLGTGALESVSPDALQPVLDRANQESRRFADLRNCFRRLLNTEEILRQLIANGSAAVGSRLDPDLADALAEDVVPTLSPRAAIHELLTSPILMESAAEDLLSPGQQATIRRRASNVGQHPWTYEDFPLLDEAAEQLGSDRSPRRYAHIVIDEAQDFSAMQLRMIRRRAGGGITILGDLAQASTGWSPATWDEHLGSGGIEVDDLEELAESYRTTRPILETANLLLLVIDLGLEPPRAVIADGIPVRATPLGAPPDDAHALSICVAELRASGREGETIGIIAPSATLERIRPALEAGGLSPSTVSEDVAASLVLVPVDEAKGLEFDHVLLVEPERIYRSDAATGPRKLYVAMTRARTSLRLLHRDRLPRVLASAAELERTDPIELSTDQSSANGPPTMSSVRLPVTVLADVLSDDGLEKDPDIPARLRRRWTETDATNAGPTRQAGSCEIPTGRGDIVLTDHPGLDRKNLIEHAERLGFSVRPEVTAGTSAVIVGRVTSTSRRARLARGLGVPLAAAQDLLRTRPGHSITGVVQDL